MALICPGCGTQNPDTNSFCQNCGTQLSVAPPVPVVPSTSVAASPFTQSPPAYTPPPGAATGTLLAPPPPYYQAPPPYYPAGGMAQPPVHRMPWIAIAAVVAALVLVMAGVGTALAIGLSHSSNTAGALNELSSPSPAVKPSALPSSVAPSSQPISSGPQTESNDGVTVPVPDGWTVAASDNEEITLIGPDNDASLTVASGSSSPPQTAQQNKDSIDAYFKQQYPDTKTCSGSKTTNGSLNGVQGISWELCFTLTSGAASVPATALLFVGANPSGTVYYAMYILTIAGNMPAFQKQAEPVVKGIVWKLK
jgi:zinc ribbon protein